MRDGVGVAVPLGAVRDGRLCWSSAESPSCVAGAAGGLPWVSEANSQLRRATLNRSFHAAVATWSHQPGRRRPAHPAVPSQGGPSMATGSPAIPDGASLPREAGAHVRCSKPARFPRLCPCPHQQGPVLSLRVAPHRYRLEPLSSATAFPHGSSLAASAAGGARSTALPGHGNGRRG